MTCISMSIYSMLDSVTFHRHSTDQGLPLFTPTSHLLDWYLHGRIAITSALQCNTIIWGTRLALMQQTALSTAVKYASRHVYRDRKKANLYLYRITFLDCPVLRNWRILKADNASMSAIRSCHCIGQSCLCRAC